MENLVYNNELISWTLDGEKIDIKLNKVFFASYNEESKLIYAEVGKNFIITSVHYFEVDGTCRMKYNLETGEINWLYQGISKFLTFNELIQVGYFPLKNLLLVMLNKIRKNVIALDLEGEFLYAVDKPVDYEILYFQEFPLYIAFVCEGNTNHEEQYGRSRFNFKLNLTTGILEKKALSH
ncbi:hypothetical protein IGJ55_003335 [Enterococcus sp. AZ170]|uniref:hypothetical protein n=1 Tax=unclassified Enterococcus TaxID=2608891 RepID=UPI003D2C993C